MAKNCQQILPWHHLAEVFLFIKMKSWVLFNKLVTKENRLILLIL